MPLKRFLIFLVLPVFFAFGLFLFLQTAYAATATSSINVTICGDAVVNLGELCDDGPSNNGGYQSSIINRKCNTDCLSYGPYCGDSALHSAYGETCDDGDNNSLDGCSAICQIEAVSPGGGGGGGGPYIGGSPNPSNPTKVVASGKAYPNSDVRVLKDGEVLGIVKADTNADFSFTTTNITAGITTFGFWSEDSNGLKSTLFTVTIRVISNAVTTIAGIYLPPTIMLDKKSAKKGEIIKISGTTVPGVDVITHVNSEEEIVKNITSKDDGSWILDFDTTPLLEDDFHTAKS